MKKVSEYNYRDYKKNNRDMEWRNIKQRINEKWWWDGNKEEVNEHSLHFNVMWPKTLYYYTLYNYIWLDFLGLYYYYMIY